MDISDISIMNNNEMNGKHEIIRDFSELSEDAKELISIAIDARKFSYRYVFGISQKFQLLSALK